MNHVDVYREIEVRYASEVPPGSKLWVAEDAEPAIACYLMPDRRSVRFIQFDVEHCKEVRKETISVDEARARRRDLPW